MRENEFEKQVKQKMDELRLHPSEPVWLEIKSELIKKRRRRLLFFIPLFVLLMTGAYFTWVSGFSKKQTSIVVERNDLANKKQNSTSTGIDNNKNEQPVESENRRNEITVDRKNQNNVRINKPKDENKSNTSIHESRSIKTDIKITSSKTANEFTKPEDQNFQRIRKESWEEEKEIKSADGVFRKDIISYDKEMKKDMNENVAENASKELNTPLHQISAISNDSKGENFNSTRINSINNQPVAVVHSSQNKIIPGNIAFHSLIPVHLPSIRYSNSINRKWKIGFSLAMGASSRTEKPFQLIHSSSAEKNFAPGQFFTGGSTSGVVNGGVYVLPPSEVKPGAAFKAGAVIMKSVSRRFDISSGLFYSYTSDHIQVGKPISQSATASALSLNLDVRNQTSYTNIQKSNYTNKYHYIEIPVSVSYNFTRKWKIPVSWDAGVSVSRLMSTNALLYDVAWGGVYYDGRKDINKTQVNLSTGFSFRMGGSTNWQWNIGPKIYVSATQLFNNAYDNNRHPVYGGLHVQALMPAKKKRN